ncbi:Predicted dehydrogenase [Micromonospora haikouensis]|uniref:Predicted dehydrogenase n=1 Tax=Micromonospora haikouensis TaxID=686309 RepID=A0A1C4YQD9_9ACTN|nr:Gfo/Idh/MocA family oxidoreductase [Micromonospora haikouensis]SCF22880.1 Predicted dehydrogenase [Micromonospora haikouensis]
MRIAVTGGGDGDDGRADHHRRRLRAMPGVELVDTRPDAVVVCGGPSLHRELTERAAAAGAHVLCEPPLAGGVPDAEAMVDACAHAGVSLTLAHPTRFSPAFEAARRAVADGRLGRLGTVNGVCHPDWATHLVDLVDVLLDGEQAAEVYARASTVAPASVLVVRYPGGSVATLGHGCGTPGLELVGERATVRFDPFARLLDVRATGRDGDRGDGRRDDRSAGRLGGADLDAAMLAAFVAGVRDGRPQGPDAAAGLRGLRIARAARRSLDTGRPAPVDHRPGGPG